MRARSLHRALAALLAVFVVAHLANHAMVFFGAEAHLAVQRALRVVYRHPMVEPLLLGAFAVQIGLGLRLVWQRGWPVGRWARLQSVSGVLLALFLAQHIIAALITRAFVPSIDTDIHWAASVVSRPGFAAYFAPYYWLGVSALFAHGAAALALRARRPRAGCWLIAIGAVYAACLVAGLMGAFGEMVLPAGNEAYLDNYWFSDRR